MNSGAVRSLSVRSFALCHSITMVIIITTMRRTRLWNTAGNYCVQRLNLNPTLVCVLNIFLLSRQQLILYNMYFFTFFTSFTQHCDPEMYLCCSIPFLFDRIPLDRHATVCVSIYLLMDIWVVSGLDLLPIKLQWKLGHTKKKLISRHFLLLHPAYTAPSPHHPAECPPTWECQYTFLKSGFYTSFCPMPPEKASGPGERSKMPCVTWILLSG